MEEIAAALHQYGLETVILALSINLCTTLCKIPIKILARKSKNSANITRFIVFMPIVLGFVLVLCYARFITNRPFFDKSFMQLWLTASSLSLTFYAVWEKIFPCKNMLKCDSETEASKELIDAIANSVEKVETERTEINDETIESQKIVLKGRGRNEIEK